MELLLRIVKWSILAGSLTLVLLALKGPLDRRYRAKWRYWLWLALAAALVLSPVPWGNLLPEQVQDLEPPVVVRVPQTTIVVGVEGVSLAPQEELEGNILPVEPVANMPADQAQQETAGKETKLLPLDAVLTAVWLAGHFPAKFAAGAVRPRRRPWPSAIRCDRIWGSNGWCPWRCVLLWILPWR